MATDAEKGKLKRALLKKFLPLGIIGGFCLLLMAGLSVFMWVLCREGEVSPLLAVGMTAVTLFVGVTFAVTLRPFFRDLRHFRRGEIRGLYGSVLRFRREEEQQGESSAVYYRPVLLDRETLQEVELKIEGLQPEKLYRVLFLPETRLGTAEEVPDGQPVRLSAAAQALSLSEHKRELQQRFFRPFRRALAYGGLALALCVLLGWFFWSGYAAEEFPFAAALLVTLLFAGNFLFWLISLLPYLRDLADCRAGQFRQMTGRVVRYREQTGPSQRTPPKSLRKMFSKEVRSEAPDPLISTDRPIVREVRTGEEFKLLLPGTCLNGVYEILYLPHTGIGVVIAEREG